MSGDPGETGEEARTCPQYLSAKVFSKVLVLPFIQLGEPCVSIDRTAHMVFKAAFAFAQTSPGTFAQNGLMFRASDVPRN